MSSSANEKEAQHQRQEQLSHINYLGLQSLQGSLSDNITCNAYIQAILGNYSQIYGKYVLHLTTGCNCLYSIYAAQAGAAKVFCVINGHGEIQAKNVYMMREIVKENQWEDIIQVKFFKDFNSQVDVIIGQPMGFNMIYDGLLDRMIEARDLYMKDPSKGLILPTKIRYKSAFIRDQQFIDRKVQFWNQVYGIHMKSMKNWISHEPMVRFIDPSLIVSQATKFIDYDIRNVTYEQIDNIKKVFTIRTPMNVIANGISIWFELQFKKSDGQKIQIKTSPFCQRTKWTQMTLYGKKIWQLKAGEQRMISFSGKKNHIQGTTILKVKVDEQEQQIYRFS